MEKIHEVDDIQRGGDDQRTEHQDHSQAAVGQAGLGEEPLGRETGGEGDTDEGQGAHHEGGCRHRRTPAGALDIFHPVAAADRVQAVGMN